MGYLRERVSYLKGLAEGMQISDASNEGKLLKVIVEVLDDVALAVEDVEEVQEQLSEQVDNIDEDLAEIEKVVFDDECCEEDMCFAEVECPHCHDKIELDEDMIDDEGNTFECPNCHEKVEIEWDCGCEDCGHDH